MNEKTFKIVPAGTSMYIALLVLYTVLLIPFVSLAIATNKDWHNSASGLWVGIFGILLIIAIALLFAFFARSARTGRFIIDTQGLKIKGFLYGRTLDKNDIVVEGIFAVDMHHMKDYRPVIRTNGVGLPGYLEGWFRLKGWKKSLLFVTNRSKVVYVPTTKGYSILLSTEEPKQFIDSAAEIWKE